MRVEPAVVVRKNGRCSGERQVFRKTAGVERNSRCWDEERGRDISRPRDEISRTKSSKTNPARRGNSNVLVRYELPQKQNEARYGPRLGECRDASRCRSSRRSVRPQPATAFVQPSRTPRGSARSEPEATSTFSLTQRPANRRCIRRAHNRNSGRHQLPARSCRSRG